MRIKEGYRIYNTWCGEPSKLILLEKAIEVIKRDNLLERTKKSGVALQNGLNELQEKYSNRVSNVRGLATFAAFDMPDVKMRDKFVEICISNGLHIGGCGEASIRFRPALIFEEKHVKLTMDRLSKSLAAL